MRKGTSISLFVLLLAAAIATSRAFAAGQEVRECDFEVKARCASGDAAVTLVAGKVTKIEVSAIWCGLPGHPTYSCTIDASRGDKESKWPEEGGATLIDNASPFNAEQPDRLKITVGKFVSIDMEEAQSAGRCGTGAELPRAIVIPARKGRCRVWLSKP